MKVTFGSIILLIVLASILWYMLSPTFSKFGSFVGKKAKKFKGKWEEKKNE